MPKVIQTELPTDVHGVEVRPGLVLVFHHQGVPREAALAAVRASLGDDYELVPVKTDAETIPVIDEAMSRHEPSDPEVRLIPTKRQEESN